MSDNLSRHIWNSRSNASPRGYSRLYYSCKGRNSGGMMMGLGGVATLSNLMCDDKLVLDKDRYSIKGLLVCGNTLRGRYGLGYGTPFAGNSIGMALTHGWLAGKFAVSMWNMV